MKVIKAVGEGPERRTYVEGGPECPNGIYLKHPDGTRSAFTSHINCPACHGTGLLAVELWRDEQLDVLLNTHFDTWDLRMRRELHTNEPIYQVEGEPWTLNFPCAETSRGAKVAAVIAVAEEEK